MGNAASAAGWPAGILGLSDEELRALSRNAALRDYARGSQVVVEGDRTDGLYIILSGEVKVFLSDAAGHELILTEQGPGECFGEIVLDDGPRTA